MPKHAALLAEKPHSLDRLFDDIEATVRDPARPLATPIDQVFKTLADESFLFEFTFKWLRTNEEVRQSFRWFVRGLALQHRQQADTAKRWAEKIEFVLDLNLIGALSLIHLLAGFSSGGDNEVANWVYYATFGLIVADCGIGMPIWYFLTMRAIRAGSKSWRLNRLADL